mgnify:CR=1 FL=1
MARQKRAQGRSDGGNGVEPGQVNSRNGLGLQVDRGALVAAGSERQGKDRAAGRKNVDGKGEGG